MQPRTAALLAVATAVAVSIAWYCYRNNENPDYSDENEEEIMGIVEGKTKSIQEFIHMLRSPDIRKRQHASQSLADLAAFSL
jgi:hypothetical protein